MRTLTPKKLLRTVMLTVSALMVGLFHPGLAEAQSSCPAGFQQGTDAFGVQGCVNVGYQCPPHGSWSVRDNKCDCLPEWPVWDDNAKQCFASSCPAGFMQGTDAFGVQGCINVGYKCPTHGSWSVQDNKCDCLPQWPVWNNDIRQCIVSSCPAGFQLGTDAFGVQGCINVGYQCPPHGSWSVEDNKCDCLPGFPVWDNNAKQCFALASAPPAPPVASCPELVTYWPPTVNQDIKDWCGLICPQSFSCYLALGLEKAFEISFCAGVAVAVPFGAGTVGLACSILTTEANVPQGFNCQSMGCHCGCLHVPRPTDRCIDPQGRHIC